MYVDEVILSDFRAIAASRVAFVHPEAEGGPSLELSNLNVVLGINGGGKSSLLKALATGFALARDEPVPNGAEDWSRYGGSGTLRVEVRWSDDAAGDRSLSSLLYQWPRGGEAVWDGDPPDGLVAEYGPVRLVGDDRSTVLASLDERRSPLLFDDAPLMPLDAWFGSSTHQDEVAQILNAVLPDGVAFIGDRHSKGDYFTQRDLALPREALSDGIRGFLAWICDLLWRLDQVAGERLDEVRGVVLVDEIDQRMHPGWQQAVLTRLGATLPSLQFICTAHSPLIPSGLRRRNLLLAEPDPRFLADGATMIRHLETEEVYGRTADQVLQSSYFSMASSRSEVFRRELRAMALQSQDRTSGRQAAVDFMRLLSDPDGSKSSGT